MIYIKDKLIVLNFRYCSQGIVHVYSRPNTFGNTNSTLLLCNSLHKCV